MPWGRPEASAPAATASRCLRPGTCPAHPGRRGRAARHHDRGEILLMSPDLAPVPDRLVGWKRLPAAVSGRAASPMEWAKFQRQIAILLPPPPGRDRPDHEPRLLAPVPASPAVAPHQRDRRHHLGTTVNLYTADLGTWPAGVPDRQPDRTAWAQGFKQEGISEMAAMGVKPAGAQLRRGLARLR